MSKSPSQSPSHRAFVVSTPKNDGEKDYWREIGVVWPHKSGNGFDVVIHEGVAVYGRIVCRQPKEKGATAPAPNTAPAGDE